MGQTSKASVRKKSPTKGGRRIAENAVKDDSGEILIVCDVATATEYTEKFFADPRKYTGGFRKYITKNGPSNKQIIKDLPIQGLVKTSLACIRQLCDLVADGDAEANKIIDLMIDYIPAQLKRSGTDGISRREAEIRVLQKLGAHFPG